MEERKEPKFLQFGDGEVIEGVLVSVARVNIKEKPATRYTVRDLETGEFSAFLGTYQLDTKLQPGDVGKFIRVRCEGENKDVGRNGNSMKLFKVEVSKQRVSSVQPGRADPGITDDDIPF